MIEPTINILEIKSDKSEILKVETFLKDIFDRNNLPLKEFNRVFLCISEAVINSIIHGNKNDKNKKVYISADCCNQQIQINIKDEGNGFDYNQVDDPTIEENLKKESGRGIHIIKNLVDSVKFNKKGNSIQFKIYCK